MSEFKPKYAIDWMLHTEKPGYVVDCVLPKHGSMRGGRYASYPVVPEEALEDPDMHVYLVASGIEAIARGMLAQLPADKVAKWDRGES